MKENENINSEERVERSKRHIFDIKDETPHIIDKFKEASTATEIIHLFHGHFNHLRNQMKSISIIDTDEELCRRHQDRVIDHVLSKYKFIPAVYDAGDGTAPLDVMIPQGWSGLSMNVVFNNYSRLIPVENYDKICIKYRLTRTNSNIPNERGFVKEDHVGLILIRLALAWRNTFERMLRVSYNQINNYISNCSALKQDNRIDTLKVNFDDIGYHANVYFLNIFDLLYTQTFAPNTPQWFNTGIYELYQFKGSSNASKGKGYYRNVGESILSECVDQYRVPQTSACFIQGLDDNLLGPKGIYEMLVNDATAFSSGSGTGVYISNLRGAGEALSSGGVSSGSLSFTKLIDTSGCVIKSGSSRRSAKMIQCSITHPDIIDFIDWKMKEENKVLNLATSSHLLRSLYFKFLDIICESDETLDPALYNTETRIGRAYSQYLEFIKEYPTSVANRMISTIQSICDIYIQSNECVSIAEFKTIFVDECPFPEYDTSFTGEGYESTFGRAVNVSIRMTDDFMNKVDDIRKSGGTKDHMYDIVAVSDRSKDRKESVNKMFNKIAMSAYISGDPGLTFHDTVNKYNTCKNDGEIVASNPCQEYVFLDDTSCNLASIKLTNFYDSHNRVYDYDKLIRVSNWVSMTLDITISMSKFPSMDYAKGSISYRTLGLGFTDLAALFIQMGMGYGDKNSQLVTAALSGCIKLSSAFSSMFMADIFGAFNRYDANKEPYINVLETQCNNLNEFTTGIMSQIKGSVIDVEDKSFNNRLKNVYLHINGDAGRLAHKIGSDLLDLITCFSERLGRMKTGEYKMRNAQLTCIAPTGTISYELDCSSQGIEPMFATKTLKKFITGATVTLVNPHAINILKTYFNGDKELEALLVKEDGGSIDDFEHIFALNENFRSIFKVAVDTLESNTVTPHDHISIAAAAQLIICGSISKTINIKHDCTVEDIRMIYMEAWRSGIKGMTVYRNNSKLDQVFVDENDKDAIEKNEKQWKDMFTDFSDRKTVINPTVVYGKPSAPTIPSIMSLPSVLNGKRRKLSINGENVYINIYEDDDGNPVEIFIAGFKSGSIGYDFLKFIGIAFSVMLQYRIPLGELIEKFKGNVGTPKGFVSGDDTITSCTSIINLTMQILENHYLNKGKDVSKAKLTIDDGKFQHIDSNDDKPIYIDPNSTINTESSKETENHYKVCPECGEKAAVFTSQTCFTCTACFTVGPCG